MDLSLHGGYAPRYLIERMTKLSHAISKVIVDYYGEHELLRRLSDPLWFQAFGCVLGFAWHSSGVMTVVTGVLRQALTVDIHGICIARGKGRKSKEAKREIPRLAEWHYNLSSAKIKDLVYASKMAAKVDNALVQDGYSLYHQVILFDREGNWTLVQQGLNDRNLMARRYHWISDYVKSYVTEPHSGIICASKNSNTLNMTSVNSIENQKVSLELATGDITKLKSSVKKIGKIQIEEKIGTLDKWTRKNDNSPLDLSPDNDAFLHYQMPRRLNWNMFKKI